MNPDGTAKHLGSVMAPNEELALAKAEKNFSSEAKEGCSIFVKEDQFDDQGGTPQ
jgi:1,2-phenylacetyl-CoA epoxidase PaaB subunit